MIGDVRPISQKWFSESAPVNYKPASAEITGKSSKKMTVYANDAVTDAEIEVVLADKSKADLGVNFIDGIITITLATTVAETPTADDTKNTFALIAAEIKKINGFDADYGENATGVLAEPTVTNIEFTDGEYGTPCMQKGVCLADSNYYYVCLKSDNTTRNDGWRRFTLSDY